MTVTITIPEQIEREAAARGIAVEALIEERLNVVTSVVDRPGFTRFGTPLKTAAEAGADIRARRARNTLGNEVTIRQLIEEGRDS